MLNVVVELIGITSGYFECTSTTIRNIRPRNGQQSQCGSFAMASSATAVGIVEQVQVNSAQLGKFDIPVHVVPGVS